MPPKPQKVLVIGSGPIVIGQAAEFDYAGTQACKALREEGVTTVLVNSNPATIMTDEGIADIVYIEPLTVEVVTRIIEAERPDGILPTLGGQTGLNLAVDLADAGVLDRYGVRLLGTGRATPAQLRATWPELEAVSDATFEHLETDARYEKYLVRQSADIEALRRDEALALPPGLDYTSVAGLSNEVRAKLARARPASLGAASRIPGVTPAALSA